MLLFGSFFLLLEIMIEFIRVINLNYFAASGNHFRFFCQKKQFFRIVETYFSTNASLLETYFLTNPSFQLLEKGFLFSGNRVLLILTFFNIFSSQPVKTHFSVQKKKYCFLFRTYLPANGKHYLNYKEAYLKLLPLLLAKIFFDFSDISANVSSFFVQQKRILKQILHSSQ